MDPRRVQLPRPALIAGGLLLAVLAILAVVADRALVAQERGRREAAALEAAESARRAGLAMRAALGEIEEAASEGRASAAREAWQVAAPPRRRVPGRASGSLAGRTRPQLAALLGSRAVTPSGLPEAVAAAIALGGGDDLAIAGERLLAGEYPVDPDDVAFLARRLGIEGEASRELERRLRKAPDPASLPDVPSFQRSLDGAIVLGWARRQGRLVHYEIEDAALILAAGLEGSVQAGRPPGALAVVVPDLEALPLSAIAARAPMRPLAMRALLWAAVATCAGAGVALARSLDREHRLVAREKEFLATVTHELRTPVAAVKLFGETLAAGRGDAREYGVLIAAESERLEALSERVLTAARLESAPRLAEADPHAIIEEALAPIRPRAARADKELLAHFGALPAATWDALAVRHAVMNLLDNALRHGASRVRLEAREEAGSVVIAVTDDGPGIARRDRRRIFERFERGASHAAGSGLGLWLVDQVARAHGGSVDVASVPGGGASFTLRLPLAPPSREEA